jgi:uncharacterized protein YjiS (DUF1127 family)
LQPVHGRVPRRGRQGAVASEGASSAPNGLRMTRNAHRQSAYRVATTLRLIARCFSCYLQMRHEQSELSRFRGRSLRDIGLTTYDVATDARQPVWQRCWRSVRSCHREPCHRNVACLAVGSSCDSVSIRIGERMSPNVEVTDLAPGLWIWRLDHPAWTPQADWQQVVTCICADVGG